MESLEISRTLVDQAYEVILDALCDGTFKTGERLTQENIAARLNVSRQPVTHALTVLKAQGFLAQSGRRGLTVTAVDPDFFAALYQFRSAVEPLAVRLATPHMTKHALQQGRALVRHGRAVAKAHDSRAILQADMDFHSFIYRLSGNPLIEDTLRLHWHHLRRAMGQVLRLVPATGVWDEHARILEAMNAGDAEGAAEMMRRHLLDAYDRVRPIAGAPPS